MNQLCLHVVLNIGVLIDVNSWKMYSSICVQDVDALRMGTSHEHPEFISNMFQFHIL